MAQRKRSPTRRKKTSPKESTAKKSTTKTRTPNKKTSNKQVKTRSRKDRNTPTRASQEVQRDAEPDNSECVVVGIGASAGGLEAFRKFLGAMPHDSGMAFVLIQHLDPDHESLMANLLSKYTSMPVVQAQDATAIEPNRVYMIPPNKFIKVRDGGLLLDQPVKHRGIRMPIDYFFRSLAEQHRERAVGIILSGTGSDGTLGLKDIKARGGMIMVQQPDTADYDGMPRSALSTGMVDLSCTIEDMPDALVKYVQHPYIDRAGDGQPTLLESSPDHYQSIINLLRVHTDYDFRCYKKGTLSRRIQRRMGLRHVAKIADYLEMLRKDRDEMNHLFKDLLISVTAFFREKEAWAELETEVVARCISEKKFDQPVRVWIPGCATGEEAYSIAMLVYEQMELQNKSLDLQIFATDLDEDAINTARRGVYPASIAADISPTRLKKFFQEDGERYRVNKRLREASVFAVQNLIGDPPFSNLDLVSCRNVMIYLEQEIQQKMIQMFHFALRPGGNLFLGASESIGKHGKLFHPVSKQWRIFRKTGATKRGAANFPIIPPGDRAGDQAVVEAVGYEKLVGSVELATKILLEKFAPASVLINRAFEVQYFHGPVRQYLDIPSGEPTTDLTAMCLKGLRSKLRGIIHQCLHEGQPATAIAPRVRRNGETVSVEINVDPLPHRRGSEPMLLVSFSDDGKPEPDENPAASGKNRISKNKARASSRSTQQQANDVQHLVEQLEYELQATREDLQSTIEELETSNEELKASNEEVMSMNEELQSTNEELETSREELQSLNEELSTVNSQLEEKVNELENTNNDLTNLLSSTEIATIFLDTEFRIRRFTPATMELLHVIDTDIGRPIRDLSPRFNDPDLYRDAREVLENLAPVEREVCVETPHVRQHKTVADEGEEFRSTRPGDQRKSEDSRWFIRRILPYRTSENRIDGVVITLTDVSTLKQSGRRLELREHQTAVVARLGRAALAGEALDSLFDQAVEQVAETLDTEMCKVLELLPGGRDVFLAAGVGWQDGLVGKAKVPTGIDSQAGYTLQTSSPVIVEDLRKEKRFSGPALLTDHGVVSGMSVIIGPQENPWGVLGTHSTRSINFTIDDANFLQVVAHVLWDAIERQRTESMVRRQLVEINAIYDSAPAGLCFVDADLRYVRINDRLAAINGPSASEHIGKTIRQVLPKLADTIEPIYQRVVETGEPEINVEVHGSTSAEPDVERDWLVSYFPLKIDAKVWGVNSVVLDITERKRQSRELLEAKNRVSEILESINDAFVSVSRDWRYKYVNPTATELLEKSEEELLGKVIWDVLPDLDRTAFGAALREAAEKNHDTEVEAFYSPHGRWYRCRNYPSPQGVSIYFTDVTRIHRAQQQLRESEERLRLAAEAAHVGTYDADLTTGNVHWSTETRRILGLAEDDIVPVRAGDIPVDRVHPEDQQRVAKAVRESLDARGSGIFDDEHRIIRPDGKTHWVRVQGQTMFAGDGDSRRAVRATGTMVDVTARKKAELKLKQLNETLEQRVEQRASLIKLLHDVTTACHNARTMEDAVAYVLRAFSHYGGWCFGHAFRPKHDDPDVLVPFMDCYEEAPGRFKEFREATSRLRLKTGQGLPGRVFATGIAKLVVDQVGEQVFWRRDEIAASGIKTAAAFPVLVANEVVAVLEFFSDKPHELDERTIEAMQSIGSQLGRVVERMRLQREVAELASQEQQRIGSELHDTVIQQLTGSEMMAESLRQKIAGAKVPEEAEAAHLVDTLKDAQQQVRRLHRGLMPVEIDAAGLMSALESLADQTGSTHAIQCTYECDEDVLIPDNTMATYLYRIAKEAVHNAIKHAKPNQITISLTNGEQMRRSTLSDHSRATLGVRKLRVLRRRQVRGIARK